MVLLTGSDRIIPQRLVPERGTGEVSRYYKHRSKKKVGTPVKKTNRRWIINSIVNCQSIVSWLWTGFLQRCLEYDVAPKIGTLKNAIGTFEQYELVLFCQFERKSVPNYRCTIWHNITYTMLCNKHISDRNDMVSFQTRPLSHEIDILPFCKNSLKYDKKLCKVNMIFGDMLACSKVSWYRISLLSYVTLYWAV